MDKGEFDSEAAWAATGKSFDDCIERVAVCNRLARMEARHRGLHPDDRARYGPNPPWWPHSFPYGLWLTLHAGTCRYTPIPGSSMHDESGHWDEPILFYSADFMTHTFTGIASR